MSDEIAQREAISARYTQGLSDCVRTPAVAVGATSVWAQYTLRLDGRNRDRFVALMADAGIPVRVYYPKPLHWQDAYRNFPIASANGLAVSEQLAASVVSLPMHAYLTVDEQDYIIDCARRSLARC